MCVAACLAGCAQAQTLAQTLAGPGFSVLNTSSYAYGPGTTLFAYPVGFPLITCNASQTNPTQAVNISVSGASLLPATRADATSPYPAVQATVRESWPNNVTGTSVGTDQSVFALTDEIFFNLDTGAVWVLDGTQYLTFNRSLDGVTARNPNTRSVQTLQYVSPASFYSGGAGLDYTEIPAPRTANQTNTTSNGTVYLNASQSWTKAVERLFYYTELVTMQASTTTPCTNDSSGWYQLTPLVDYLLYNVLAANTSYSPRSLTVLDNVTLPNLVGLTPTFYASNLTGSTHYTDLVSSASFLPVNTTLRVFTTPTNSAANGMTQCLTACREYEPANPAIPHCNVWNWCNSTSGCTYALNATQNSIPLHTCLLGYSAPANQNLPVAPVNLANAGYWSGRSTAIKPYNITGSIANATITTTNFTLVSTATPAAPASNTTARAPATSSASVAAPARTPAASPAAAARNATSPAAVTSPAAAARNATSPEADTSPEAAATDASSPAQRNGTSTSGR